MLQVPLDHAVRANRIRAMSDSHWLNLTIRTDRIRAMGDGHWLNLTIRTDRIRAMGDGHRLNGTIRANRVRAMRQQPGSRSRAISEGAHEQRQNKYCGNCSTDHNQSFKFLH